MFVWKHLLLHHQNFGDSVCSLSCFFSSLLAFYPSLHHRQLNFFCNRFSLPSFPFHPAAHFRKGKASHFCPRPSAFRPRSGVIPISCCFREWHWTTLEWRWRSERKERKWGRGWLWLVSASFDTVWPSFVRAVVGSTSFLSLYGTIHFVIPYSFWNKMI